MIQERGFLPQWKPECIYDFFAFHIHIYHPTYNYLKVVFITFKCLFINFASLKSKITTAFFTLQLNFFNLNFLRFLVLTINLK